MLETWSDAKNPVDNNGTHLHFCLVPLQLLTLISLWSKSLENLFSSQEFSQAHSLNKSKYLCPQTEHTTYNVIASIFCCEMMENYTVTYYVSHWHVGKTLTWDIYSTGEKAEDFQCHIWVQLLALPFRNYVILNELFYLL